MKKPLSLILLLFCLPVLIAGLQSCGDDCPSYKSTGGPSKYKLIGGHNSYFYDSDSSGDRTKIHKEFDTISITKPVQIHLYFNTELVAIAEPNHNYAGVLLACSPYPAQLPLPTQTIHKIAIIAKSKFGTSFAANDTINNHIKHYKRSNLFPFPENSFPLSTLINSKAEQELKLLFTPPQPVTEITAFQIEAILTLSDSSEVRLTSKMVYLKN